MPQQTITNFRNLSLLLAYTLTAYSAAAQPAENPSTGGTSKNPMQVGSTEKIDSANPIKLYFQTNAGISSITISEIKDHKDKPATPTGPLYTYLLENAGIIFPDPKFSPVEVGDQFFLERKNGTDLLSRISSNDKKIEAKWPWYLVWCTSPTAPSLDSCFNASKANGLTENSLGTQEITTVSFRNQINQITNNTKSQTNVATLINPEKATALLADIFADRKIRLQESKKRQEEAIEKQRILEAKAADLVRNAKPGTIIFCVSHNTNPAGPSSFATDFLYQCDMTENVSFQLRQLLGNGWIIASETRTPVPMIGGGQKYLINLTLRKN